MLAVFLPRPLKPAYYRAVFGWKIGKGVRIGLSLIDAQSVEIGDGVHIGHLNLFRKLNELKIGSQTWISNSNQFFGGRGDPKFPSCLHIGRGVSWMSRHYVDASGTVEILDGAVLAGRDTHIWSHSIKVENGLRVLGSTTVRIGQSAYIGARSTIVLSNIPDHAMVGAGSVVTRSFPEEASPVLIAGNPACVKKRYTAAATPNL
jgi:acetyltransferase-like isoleucine patch superfamily enzyme